MASVQFAPLAIWITDDLLRKRMYDHLHALQAMANRSDSHGLTRCGPTYIGGMIGLGRDKAEALLDDFVMWGWVKIHEHVDPFTRSKTVWKQLSPDILAIRDENVPYALELWGHDGSLSSVLIESPSPDHDPDLDPEPESRLNPDFDPEPESRLKPAAAPESVIEDDTPRAVVGPKSEKQKAKSQKQSETPARSAKPAAPHGAKTPSPHSAAPPPQSRQERAKRYAQQLADGEALAQKIVAAAPTRIWQARELVDRYGVQVIEIALAQLAATKERETVLNPFGLLNYWLKHGEITPNDKLYGNLFVRSRPEHGSPYDDVTAAAGGD